MFKQSFKAKAWLIWDLWIGHSTSVEQNVEYFGRLMNCAYKTSLLASRSILIARIDLHVCVIQLQHHTKKTRYCTPSWSIAQYLSSKTISFLDIGSHQGEPSIDEDATTIFVHARSKNKINLRNVGNEFMNLHSRTLDSLFNNRLVALETSYDRLKTA